MLFSSASDTEFCYCKAGRPGWLPPRKGGRGSGDPNLWLLQLPKERKGFAVGGRGCSVSCICGTCSNVLGYATALKKHNSSEQGPRLSGNVC